MENIGIDLGSKVSQVCVRNGVGVIVEEKRCRTDQVGRYLGKRAPGRVVLETCTEAFRIAGRARRQGHDVRVVAATLVRSLGVGPRVLRSAHLSLPAPPTTRTNWIDCVVVYGVEYKGM